MAITTHAQVEIEALGILEEYAISADSVVGRATRLRFDLGRAGPCGAYTFPTARRAVLFQRSGLPAQPLRQRDGSHAPCTSISSPRETWIGVSLKPRFFPGGSPAAAGRRTVENLADPRVGAADVDRRPPRLLVRGWSRLSSLGSSESRSVDRGAVGRHHHAV